MAKAKRKYVGSVQRAKRRVGDIYECTGCGCPLSGTKEDTHFIPIAKEPICFNCSDMAGSLIRGAQSLLRSARGK